MSCDLGWKQPALSSFPYRGRTVLTVGPAEPATLSLRRLEDHLWQAADLFRNKVSNQKDYILALLFFKRASDLYKDETEAALAELGDVAERRRAGVATPRSTRSRFRRATLGGRAEYR